MSVTERQPQDTSSAESGNVPDIESALSSLRARVLLHAFLRWYWASALVLDVDALLSALIFPTRFAHADRVLLTLSLLLLPVAIGIARCFMVRLPADDLARLMDARAGLKERVATSLEYSQRERQSGMMTQLLAHNAVSSLRSVRPADIVSIRFDAALAAIALLLTLALCLWRAPEVIGMAVAGRGGSGSAEGPTIGVRRVAPTNAGGKPSAAPPDAKPQQPSPAAKPSSPPQPKQSSSQSGGSHPAQHQTPAQRDGSAGTSGQNHGAGGGASSKSGGNKSGAHRPGSGGSNAGHSGQNGSGSQGPRKSGSGQGTGKGQGQGSHAGSSAGNTQPRSSQGSPQNDQQNGSGSGKTNGHLPDASNGTGTGSATPAPGQPFTHNPDEHGGRGKPLPINPRDLRAVPGHPKPVFSMPKPSSTKVTSLPADPAHPGTPPSKPNSGSNTSEVPYGSDGATASGTAVQVRAVEQDPRIPAAYRNLVKRYFGHNVPVQSPTRPAH